MAQARKRSPSRRVTSGTDSAANSKYPWREPIKSAGNQKLARIPVGEAVELFGRNKVGGEGEVCFGFFTKPAALRQAVSTILAEGTWDVFIRRQMINHQPGDLRGWR